MPVPLVIPLVRSGTQFSALAGDLPVGADYSFTASAIDGSTPPVELYHGSVTNQVIRKNTTANIVIDMNQIAPGVRASDQGPCSTRYRCRPSWPLRRFHQLKAVAHDPDAGQTALLTFSWRATCGSIGGNTVTPGSDTTPSISDAVFTAPSMDGAASSA